MIPEYVLFYEEDIVISPKSVIGFEFNTIYTSTNLLYKILSKYLPRVLHNIYEWKITKDDSGLYELYWRASPSDVGSFLGIDAPSEDDYLLDCVKFKGINNDQQDYIYSSESQGNSQIIFTKYARREIDIDSPNRPSWYKIYFNQLSKGYYKKNSYRIRNEGISYCAISQDIEDLEEDVSVPKTGDITPKTIDYIIGSSKAWIPGYQIQDKNVSGTICDTTLPSIGGYGFGFSTTKGDPRTYRGDNNHRYWDLIPGAPKILVHNFNKSIPEWIADTDFKVASFTTRTEWYDKAEQIYEIDKEGLFSGYDLNARDTLDDGEPYDRTFVDYSEQPGVNKDNITKKLKVYDKNARALIIYNNPNSTYSVSMSSYESPGNVSVEPLKSNKLKIKLSGYGEKEYYINNLKEQKIIFCVRKQVSLQKEIDFVSGRRFFYLWTARDADTSWRNYAYPFSCNSSLFSVYAATEEWLKNHDTITISPNFPFSSKIYNYESATGLPDKSDLIKNLTFRLLPDAKNVVKAVQIAEQECGISLLKRDSEVYTTTWEEWEEGPKYHDCFGGESYNKIKVTVPVNEIEYYDITDYMNQYYQFAYDQKNHKFIFSTPQFYRSESIDANELKITKPISFKNAIEKTEDTKFEITFSGTDKVNNSKNSVFARYTVANFASEAFLSVFSKGFTNITYSFTLENFTSFKTSSPAFVSTQEEISTFEYPSKYYDWYSSTSYLGAPCFLFNSNFFYLDCPPIFEESYVSFNHTEGQLNYCIPFKYQYHRYDSFPRASIYKNYYGYEYKSWFYDKKISNKDNKKFYLTATVPGWNSWNDKGYTNFMPSVWPLSWSRVGDSPEKTWYSPFVEYWASIYAPAQLEENWYPGGEYINPPQIGFNYGMVINSIWNTDKSLSWKNAEKINNEYRVPKKPLPNFGIIVCESY